MCAIVDANTVFEVFGTKQTDAGRRFRDWLDGGRGELVVGGKILDELVRNRNFERWLLEARRLSGRVRQVGRARIRQRADDLVRSGLLQSDDEHVVALALESGARLLYTDDSRLQRDFTNRQVVSGVEGRIYTSRPTAGRFTDDHQVLLQTPNLCGGAVLLNDACI